MRCNRLRDERTTATRLTFELHALRRSCPAQARAIALNSRIGRCTMLLCDETAQNTVLPGRGALVPSEKAKFTQKGDFPWRSTLSDGVIGWVWQVL